MSALETLLMTSGGFVAALLAPAMAVIGVDWVLRRTRRSRSTRPSP